MSWLRQMPRPSWGLRLKRALDVTVSGGGLLALSPVLGGLLVANTAAYGWPPTFSQVRPGYAGRPFRMWKLRSMSDARGLDGEPLPDADRLTAFGRFLRASSLDELPELWNVLRGDMSLVGPRPLLLRYLERYTPEQHRRHHMPPGITGWAQVNGRNHLAWAEKFELDVWYVDHWSLALDLRVLLRTVGAVAGREGIAEEGGATMTEFQGAACASS